METFSNKSKPNFIIDDDDIQNELFQEKLKFFSDLDTPIVNFFSGKTVVLTGGTGFVGLLLLEKLLRLDVKKVFLFVRPKKGRTPKERVDSIFNEPIYVKLRTNRDYYFNKITLVESNISDNELGLTPEIRDQITSETEIFIHTAANVRFDEHLKEAILTNVKGTYEMLRLAEETKHLLCFMYMSTAYANCPQKEIKEQFYETPMDPFCMMKLAEMLSDDDQDEIQVVTDKIVWPWPNTYAYTKALAEELMRIYCEKLPIVVVRPSIIMMTYEDPIPGWLNNLYGINGVFTGVGMGVLRIFHIDNRKKADIVPADIVVNASLAVVWHFVEKGGINNHSLNKPDEVHKLQPVFNVVSCVDNPLTWGEVKKRSVPLAKKYAPTKALWICRYNTTRFGWLYYILRIFYHVVPAFMFDFILKMQGKKPQVVLLYKKIHRFAGAITYFTNNEWKFKNDNLRMVLNSMDEKDKIFFNADLKTLKWEDIFEVFGLGIRTYLANDSIDNLPQGRARYRKMEILHYILLVVLYSVLAIVAYWALKFYGWIDYANTTFSNYDFYINNH